MDFAAGPPLTFLLIATALDSLDAQATVGRCKTRADGPCCIRLYAAPASMYGVESGRHRYIVYGRPGPVLLRTVLQAVKTATFRDRVAATATRWPPQIFPGQARKDWRQYALSDRRAGGVMNPAPSATHHPCPVALSAASLNPAAFSDAAVILCERRVECPKPSPHYSHRSSRSCLGPEGSMVARGGRPGWRARYI